MYQLYGLTSVFSWHQAHLFVLSLFGLKSLKHFGVIVGSLVYVKLVIQGIDLECDKLVLTVQLAICKDSDLKMSPECKSVVLPSCNLELFE